MKTAKAGGPPSSLEVASTPGLHAALMRLLRHDLPDVRQRDEAVRMLHMGGMMHLPSGSDVAVAVTNALPAPRQPAPEPQRFRHRVPSLLTAD